MLIALLNLAVAAAAIGVASAKIDDAPQQVSVRAPSVAAEAETLQALRFEPTSPAHHRSIAQAPAPVVSAATADIPIAGKGMWIWLFNEAEGGDPVRIVRRAKQLGLSHLYVRSSSTTSGLKFLGDIDRIVPVAHREGRKVIAWDFPTLADPAGDARRMVFVLDHRTPGGERVDGIAADLETQAEGVHLSVGAATTFAVDLERARPDRFRILVPPRPSSYSVHRYPFEIATHFDAVAPMVYWIDRDPVALVRETIGFLQRFHKPVAPIGQAYDPAEDGGPHGAPPGYVLADFADAARAAGAVGISFWSWQHATRDEFAAIAHMPFPVRHARRPRGVSQADAESVG